MAKFHTTRQREERLEGRLGKSFCFGSSSAPPQSPDPFAVAQAQGSINKDAARTSAQLSRFDQFTPYGSLTWNNDRAFDQAGYDAAMEKWRTEQANPTQGSSGYYGSDGNYVMGTGGTAGVATKEPNKDDFYTGGDKWSSKVTLDPKVQSLVDAYLNTGNKLQGSVDKALSNVDSAFATPINYGALPRAASVQEAFDAVRSKYQDISSSVGTAQGVYGQAADKAGQAMDLWQPSNLSYSGVDPLWKPNDQTRQQVIDALYGQYTRQLNPRFTQDEEKLRSTLMNRGIIEGTDAWDTQLDTFGRTKNDAYNQAGTSAITGATDQMSALLRDSLAARQQGVSEAKDLWLAPQTQAANAMQLSNSASAQLGNLTNAASQQQDSITRNALMDFNMSSAERQNALTEEERKRTLALQWLASLRGGTMPQMPEFMQPSGPNVQPANYQSAAYNTYDGQLKQYQTDVASDNATMAMMAQIIATIGGGMARSDRRLKRNIKRIGTLPTGQPWYSFDYIWGESTQGVMADESPAEAVHRGADGYLMVDYSKLGI